MKATLKDFKHLTIILMMAWRMVYVQAQDTVPDRIPDTIKLINPSFEGKPARGGENPWNLRGWKDFGSLLFEGETPPDVHPNNIWFNNQAPIHGISYVGLVSRAYGSYEAISQTLSIPLKKEHIYALTLDLCKPEKYLSPLRIKDPSKVINFNNPSILRVEGLTKEGGIKLLATSPKINHTDWRKYTFTLKPDEEIYTIILSVRHAAKKSQNCTLLIDNASDIIEIPE